MSCCCCCAAFGFFCHDWLTGVMLNAGTSWIKKQLRWASKEAAKIRDKDLRLAIKAQIAKLQDQAVDNEDLKARRIVDPIYGIIARKPPL